MAKIKIEDLPKDLKISKEELKRIRGGIYYVINPEKTYSMITSILFKSRT